MNTAELLGYDKLSALAQLEEGFVLGRPVTASELLRAISTDVWHRRILSRAILARHLSRNIFSDEEARTAIGILAKAMTDSLLDHTEAFLSYAQCSALCAKALKRSSGKVIPLRK